MNTSMKFPISK